MTTLEQAARNYCACKDRIKALVASLKRCERVAYLEETDKPWPEHVYHGTEPQNPKNDYCSRVIVDHSPGGPYDPDEGPLDEADWCQSCRDNLPTVEELKRERRRVGGLAAAMMTAYRREAKP